MRHAALLLVLLMGCAGTQHRHPHDHGLSALKGQLTRVFRDNENMFRRFQGLQIKFDEVSAKNTAIESRITDAETRVVFIDEQLMAMSKQIELRIIAVAKQFDTFDDNTGKLEKRVDRRIRSNESDIEDLEDTLGDLDEVVEKLKPPPPQKFIELDQDLLNDAQKKKEAWDGKMIGPPWPPLPKVGVELGEEEKD